MTTTTDTKRRVRKPRKRVDPGTRALPEPDTTITPTDFLALTRDPGWAERVYGGPAEALPTIVRLQRIVTEQQRELARLKAAALAEAFEEYQVASIARDLDLSRQALYTTMERPADEEPVVW